MTRGVSKILKQPLFHLKVKHLTLDRKDTIVNNHFSLVSVEKKLNKIKLREYLGKRYKDFLADRIMKNLLPFFNNFTVYYDLNMYCECLESFAN